MTDRRVTHPSRHNQPSSRNSRPSQDSQFATVAQVKRLLNKELEQKAIYTGGDQSISSSGYNVNLMPIASGSASNQRTGNEITPVLLKINAIMECVDTHNSVRLLIYRWRPDSTIDFPNIIDILNLAALSATTSPAAIVVDDFEAKLVVLVDHIFAQTLGNDDLSVFRKEMRLPPFKTTFNGTTTGSSQIFMSLVSDSAASSHPILHFMVEVKYQDA